jgi:hypothetical protein
MTPSAAFPGSNGAGRLPATGQGILSGLDAELLRFVAEMQGIQMNQLAVLLTDWGESADDIVGVARELVADWRAAGYAETGQLSLGEPWVWATRKGLDACKVRAKLVKPSARFLRHTHAVTDVRLAVQRTAAFRESGAWWRAERTILGELGYPARTQHVPDGEVHWPVGNGSPWAGETWAVEIEINPKTVERTAAIMREALTRIGGFGRVSDSNPVPSVAPQYARLVYVCSPDAVRVVLYARAEVGSPLSGRIDIHDLPESAMRLNTPKRGWDS